MKTNTRIRILQESLRELNIENEAYRKESLRLHDRLREEEVKVHQANVRITEMHAERDRIIRLTEIFTSIQITPLNTTTEVCKAINTNMPTALRK